MQQIKAQHISGGGSVYDVDQSLMFNGYQAMDQTFSMWNGLKKNTFSAWIKVNKENEGAGEIHDIFSAHLNDNSGQTLYLYDGTLRLFVHTSGPGVCGLYTKAVLRDYSAWYHILVSTDTTHPTESERAKIFINGVRVTDFTYETYFPQNADGWWGANVKHALGDYWDSSNKEGRFKGYMSEVHFINNESLGPERFALTDSNGVYNPIVYNGTYGNNGFYLPFKASDIGADESGNDNDFTLDGFTSDSVVADSPSNNYCVMNPANHLGTVTSPDGNLSAHVEKNAEIRSSIPIPNHGKWYWEGRYVSGNLTDAQFGIVDPTSQPGYASNKSVVFSASSGDVWDYSGRAPYGSSWKNDYVACAVDMDNHSIRFYVSGVAQGDLAIGGYPATNFFASLCSDNGGGGISYIQLRPTLMDSRTT